MIQYPAMSSLVSAKGPSMTVRLAPENLMRAPFELGWSPAPSRSTPAFISSSLYLPIAERRSSPGMMPASQSLLAFTIIMNLIVMSPSILISNDEPNSPGSRHGGIEERRDRGCQHGRRENAVMRQARQNSEPGIGHPRPIPAAILLAAA